MYIYGLGRERSDFNEYGVVAEQYNKMKCAEYTASFVLCPSSSDWFIIIDITVARKAIFSVTLVAFFMISSQL